MKRSEGCASAGRTGREGVLGPVRPDQTRCQLTRAYTARALGQAGAAHEHIAPRCIERRARLQPRRTQPRDR